MLWGGRRANNSQVHDEEASARQVVSDSESECEEVMMYDSLPEVRAVVEKMSKCSSTVRIAKKNSVRVGDMDVPRHGSACAEQFESEGVLEKCIEECHEVLTAAFFVSNQGLVDDFVAKKTARLSLAVSDPDGPDCPLVFVSRAFEQMTGYTADFCLGCSCRFLQCSNQILNDAVNSNDRQRMAKFCSDRHSAPGSSMLALLLNEKHDGTRFWNLLKMVYVHVSGKAYIFALQSHVDAYMPTTFYTQVEDKTLNQTIAELAEGVLEQLCRLRKYLKCMPDAPLKELDEMASERLEKMKLVVV